MFKFLRRIRRKLIDEGNLKRYMIYAVGEILLVIIGILIALQLNNLNTKQDLRQKEYILLLEVKDNLIANINQFNANINWQEEKVKDIDKIIEYSIKGISWNDTLGVAITQFQNPEEYFVNASGYESLKTIGLDIISSDTIRKSITNIYELHYMTNGIRNNEYGQLLFSVREPFMLKNFSYNHEKNAMIPNSPSSILDNQEFINIISQRRRFKQVAIGSNQWSIQETENLISLINEHLKDLN